jgi:uncharacterized protein YdaU (DUF1376 family)
MHYYQFNIGDYNSHTMHLSEIEDLTYRRLLDWYYLHESSIPLDLNEVSRQIRMRSHSDCIATVLQEFFERTPDGWIHHRANKEIEKVGDKSQKASASAKARWSKPKDANALRTQSEGNANHKPITNNHKPLTIVKEKASQRFTPPTLSEVMAYCNERGNQVDPQRFINHYGANGWMRGKNKIKDWKACVRTWEQNDNQTTTVKPVETYESTVARLTDRSWAK